MKKQTLILLLLCTLASFVFFACPAEEDTPAREYDTGTASATVTGGDGPLTVTITMLAGQITDVRITGQDYYSYGRPAIETAKDRILAHQDFDHLDVISGATITPKAIAQAGKQAIAKIKRGEFDPAP